MNNETVIDTTTDATYKMTEAAIAAPLKPAPVIDRIFDFIGSWWPPILRGKIRRQEATLTNLHKYAAEDRAYLQGLCRAAGATELELEEGSNGISSVMGLSTLLCDKLTDKIVKAAVAPAPKKAKRKSAKKTRKSVKPTESQ